MSEIFTNWVKKEYPQAQKKLDHVYYTYDVFIKYIADEEYARNEIMAHSVMDKSGLVAKLKKVIYMDALDREAKGIIIVTERVYGQSCTEADQDKIHNWLDSMRKIYKYGEDQDATPDNFIYRERDGVMVCVDLGEFFF